jgi:hypothetical protein
MYGGNGHVDYGAFGPACTFMFPGNSDSLNWGTGCVPPNGPVDWTEEDVLVGTHDCKGVTSSGPFTFKPGDRQDIDIAFAWARDYVSPDPKASVEKLRNVADKINKAFAENRLPDGTPIYGINEKNTNNNIDFLIYPNPAKNLIMIDFGQSFSGPVTVKILSIYGNQATQSKVFNANRISLNVSDLSAGMYFLQLIKENKIIGVKKFIIN